MSERLEVVIQKTSKFSAAELARFREAAEYMERVVNSPEWKERFLALKLTNTRGMTNEQVFTLVQSGKTTLEKAPDYEIDIYIEMFYSWKKTVGYTRPSTVWTWINRRFFKRFTIADIGRNLWHESVAHKAGFGHKSANELTSVPYNGGYLMQDMIEEVLAYGEPYDLMGITNGLRLKKSKAIYA